MCLKKILDEILILNNFCLFFILGQWAKKNRPSGKTVPERKVKSASFVFKRFFWGKNFHWKMCSLNIFDSWAEEYQCFVIFSHGRIFKTAFYVSKKTFWKKKFLKKFELFSIQFSDTERKIICFLSTCLSQDCENCSLPAYSNNSRRKCFLERNFSPLFIVGYWAKKCRTYGIFFGHFFKLQIIFLKVNSEEESFLNKKSFSSSFSDIERKIVRFMSRSFWAGISKVHSMFPKGSVEETLVFRIERIFFQKFCDLERKLFNNRLLWRHFFFSFGQWAKVYRFSSFFFRMVVKTAFYMSMGSF